MDEDDTDALDDVEDGVLPVRGRAVLTASELTLLRELIGEELLASATIRSWLAGDTGLTPHSVGVAVEAQLRMLFGTPTEACAVLEHVIARLAAAFPADVQPLHTD
ncbi:hypothetical protein NBH00_21745 [Paraconexibacter antarcticus]|uniref:Uncharacterized protein n=1 Tax=Paraconexibacter antarcticus TaxID=2949664 RepID=A0ABY5DPJ0_9ACTN|nr:hypothetical protein [Paraconexibacter antarcticus]UTI63953.1 hypothetical protein NBH00_21745 [Paraconexibacter antarcticus]